MKSLSVGLVIGASLASSVGNSFRSVGTELGKLQEKSRGLKLGIETGSQWKSMREESLKLSAAMQSGTLDAAGVKRFQELKRATADAAAEARKYGFTVKDLNQQLGAMRTMADRRDGFARRAEGREERRGERSELRGRLVGTMAVGAAAFGYPIKAAMDFEHSMAEVGAITRANDEDMKRLTENSREMGRTTIFSASQAAEGQKFLGMAGFNTDQIIASMPGMLDLAAASRLDLGQTADIATNILTGFGMQADEMERVGNVMALASTSTNTNVVELGYAMKYAAPNAKALGYSIEQTAAVIGKLSDAGIKGQMAGTTLRGMLDSLLDKNNIKALNEFGVKVVDSQGNLRGLDAVIKDLDAQMTKRGFGSAARASFVNDIFGARAGTGAKALWDAVLSGDLEKLTEKYTNEQDGAVRKMAERMSNTAVGKMTQLKSAIESVGIDIGNALIPHLADTFQSLSGVIGGFSMFLQQHPGITKAVVGIGAGFIGLKAATIATRIGWSHIRDGASIAMDILQRVRPTTLRAGWALRSMRGEGAATRGVFSALRGGISSFARGVGEEFRAVRAGFSALAGGVKSVGAGILGGAKSLGAGLFKVLFNPWTIAIGLLIGAAYLVWKNWDAICSGLGELWEGAKEKLAVFGTWLWGKWESLRSGFSNVAAISWDGLTNGFSFVIESIASGWESLKSGFSNVAAISWDGLTNGFSFVIEGIASGWEWLKGLFSWSGAGDLWGWISGGFSLAIEGIASGWEGLKGHFAAFPNFATTALSGLGEAIAAPFRIGFDFVEGAIGRLRGLWEGFKSIFSSDVQQFDAATASKINADASAANARIPDLKTFGTGGIVSSPTYALIGEAGREVVTPVDRPGLGIPLWMAAGRMMGINFDGDESARSEGGSSFLERLRDSVSMPSPMLAAEGFSVGDIHIHAAEGMDVNALASEVIRRIQEMTGRKKRGRYDDDAFFG